MFIGFTRMLMWRRVPLTLFCKGALGKGCSHSWLLSPPLAPPVPQVPALPHEGSPGDQAAALLTARYQVSWGTLCFSSGIIAADWLWPFPHPICKPCLEFFFSSRPEFGNWSSSETWTSHKPLSHFPQTPSKKHCFSFSLWCCHGRLLGVKGLWNLLPRF